MKDYIISLRNLRKAFGGVVAVADVSLDIEANRIIAIIGPNGAGKTTLFNLITGYYKPTSGEIWFHGSMINKVPAPKRVNLGIARTFQHILLFPQMTVMENVMTGRHTRSHAGFIEASLRLPRFHKEEENIALEATRYLNLVGLGQYARQEAMSMPYGQQKLIAIARALASEPKLLLLDEPGAGLNTMEKKDLGELIQRIRELGITVVLVEHDMDMVMKIAEWVIVLDVGRKLAEGTASQIQRDEKVIAAYLGEDDL
jgi:branched-chain amino acid transport system ATP-binding protein